MRTKHKCPDCKIKYDCTADECDEPYLLQCTPCEIKEWDSKHTPAETKKIIEEHDKKCDAILASGKKL